MPHCLASSPGAGKPAPCHEPARRGTRRRGAGRRGAALDGAALDGAALDGAALDGAALDGAARQTPSARSDRHPKRQLRWKWQEERPW
jgi:hypothetical protein